MCRIPDHTKSVWKIRRIINPVVNPQVVAGHITEGYVVQLDVGMNINVRNIKAQPIPVLEKICGHFGSLPIDIELLQY